MPMYYGSLTNETNLSGNLEAMLRWDADLFANFFLPAGLDKQTAVHTIRREYGLTPLYHPDPRWLKTELYYWSKENQEIWRRMYATVDMDYNPIWNTDVVERTLEHLHHDAQTTDDATGWSKQHQTAGKQMELYTHDDDVKDAAHQTNTEQTEHGDSIAHANEVTGQQSDKRTTGAQVTDTDTHGRERQLESQQTDTDSHQHQASHQYTHGEGTSNTDNWQNTDTKSDSTNKEDGTSNTVTAGTSLTKTTEDTTTHSDTKVYVSPENAADYQPDTNTIVDGTENKTGTVDTVTGSTSDTTTHQEGEAHATGRTETEGNVSAQTTSDQAQTGEAVQKQAQHAVGTTQSDTEKHEQAHAVGTTTGTEDSHAAGQSDKWDTAEDKRRAQGLEFGTAGEKSHHTGRDSYQDETHGRTHAEDGSSKLGREHSDDTHETMHTRQGNIGVTSTQQLIEAEREVSIFNIYQFIADSFHRTFCLDVYPLF